MSYHDVHYCDDCRQEWNCHLPWCEEAYIYPCGCEAGKVYALYEDLAELCGEEITA